MSTSGAATEPPSLQLFTCRPPGPPCTETSAPTGCRLREGGQAQPRCRELCWGAGRSHAWAQPRCLCCAGVHGRRCAGPQPPKASRQQGSIRVGASILQWRAWFMPATTAAQPAAQASWPPCRHATMPLTTDGHVGRVLHCELALALQSLVEVYVVVNTRIGCAIAILHLPCRRFKRSAQVRVLATWGGLR